MEDILKIVKVEYLRNHCMDCDLWLKRKSRVWHCSAQLVLISMQERYTFLTKTQLARINFQAINI